MYTVQLDVTFLLFIYEMRTRADDANEMCHVAAVGLTNFSHQGHNNHHPSGTTLKDDFCCFRYYSIGFSLRVPTAIFTAKIDADECRNENARR